MTEPAAVLDFWFRELTPAQWFMGAKGGLDDEVRARFGAALEAAQRGALDAWAGSPRGRLALIILLDQFSRHIFRGKAESFAVDAKAQSLSREGILSGMDKVLNFAERQFFYMPLMHAEDAELQKLSVEKFTQLRDEAASILDFATDHAAIVQRFNRFPHRNAALGRTPTAEEEAFLASGGETFS